MARDCCKGKGCNRFKAFVARIVIFIQVFLTVWRVASVKGALYWCLLLLLVPLIVEVIVNLAKREGLEFKWFAVGVLMFLIAAVPPIWLLELDRLERFNKVAGAKNVTDVNDKEGLAALFGFTPPIFIERDIWVKILQQTLILLLVAFRWIIPRGPTTRDRLSQILLVYVAMGADITELLDLFDIPGVMKRRIVFISVLSLWTISLMQFTFLYTLGSGKMRLGFIVAPEPNEAEKQASPKNESPTSTGKGKISGAEVGALIMSLFLQDVPFFCMRMYVMIEFREFSNSLLFFLSKNFYVISLQLYRLFNACCGCDEEEDDDQD